MGGKLRTTTVERKQTKYDTLKRKIRVYEQHYIFVKRDEGIDITAVDTIEYWQEHDPAIWTTGSWRSWQFWSRVPTIPVDVWQEATARFDTYE